MRARATRSARVDSTRADLRADPPRETTAIFQCGRAFQEAIDTALERKALDLSFPSKC